MYNFKHRKGKKKNIYIYIYQCILNGPMTTYDLNFEVNVI